MSEIKKVVLAYSGGLDTSIIPSTVRTLQLLLPAATTSRVMPPVLSAAMVCPPRYRLL